MNRTEVLACDLLRIIAFETLDVKVSEKEL